MELFMKKIFLALKRYYSELSEKLSLYLFSDFSGALNSGEYSFQEKRFSMIAETERSGRPLKGVGYEEYNDYYFKISGTEVSYPAYQQRVKGTAAIVRDKEWRHNDLLILTHDILNSSEYMADMEKAYEKSANGAELERYEKKMIARQTNKNGYTNPR
jgi:hypothetical protein